MLVAWRYSSKRCARMSTREMAAGDKSRAAASPPYGPRTDRPPALGLKRRLEEKVRGRPGGRPQSQSLRNALLNSPASVIESTTSHQRWGVLPRVDCTTTVKPCVKTPGWGTF